MEKNKELSTNLQSLKLKLEDDLKVYPDLVLEQISAMDFEDSDGDDYIPNKLDVELITGLGQLNILKEKNKLLNVEYQQAEALDFVQRAELERIKARNAKLEELYNILSSL